MTPIVGNARTIPKSCDLKAGCSQFAAMPQAPSKTILLLLIGRAGSGQNLGELRTATSCAQLMQSQGRTKEALQILRPVYEWFTEGFDTPDLKKAKGTLEELYF